MALEEPEGAGAADAREGGEGARGAGHHRRRRLARTAWARRCRSRAASRSTRASPSAARCRQGIFSSPRQVREKNEVIHFAVSLRPKACASSRPGRRSACATPARTTRCCRTCSSPKARCRCAGPPASGTRCSTCLPVLAAAGVLGLPRRGAARASARSRWCASASRARCCSRRSARWRTSCAAELAHADWIARRGGKPGRESTNRSMIDRTLVARGVLGTVDAAMNAAGAAFYRSRPRAVVPRRAGRALPPGRAAEAFAARTALGLEV